MNIIPYAVLGALLLFSAIQLLKSSVKTEKKIYTGITGITAFFWGMSVAFGIMLAFHLLKTYVEKNKKRVNISK